MTAISFNGLSGLTIASALVAALPAQVSGGGVTDAILVP